MILQRVLKTINNGIFSMTKHVNGNIRLLIVFVCCFLLEGTGFLYIGYYGDGINTMVYGSVLTLIIAIFSIDKKAESVRWNKSLMIPFAAFGAGMILTSFLHPIGAVYMVYALDLLLLLPFLYYVWGNRKDSHVLLRLVALAAVAEGIIAFFIIALSAIKGEMGVRGGRVYGHTSNPNILGCLGLIVLICGLYLILTKPNAIQNVVINTIASGMGLSLVRLSVSRTAMICTVACIAVFVVFVIKRLTADRNSIKMRTLALAMIVMIFTVYVGVSLSNINKETYKRNNKENAQTKEERRELRRAVKRKSLKTIEKRVSNKENINKLSSGRLYMWKTYLKNTTLFGKASEDTPAELDEYVEKRPHNNIIDYLYRFGILVGLIYVIFYLRIGIQGLKMLFGREHIKPEHFFLVTMIGCYCFYALVEIAVLSYTRVLPCMFFITIAPLMASGVSRHRRSYLTGEE